MNGKDGEDMKSTAWQSRLEIDLADKNGKIMCEKYRKLGQIHQLLQLEDKMLAVQFKTKWGASIVKPCTSNLYKPCQGYEYAWMHANEYAWP